MADFPPSGYVAVESAVSGIEVYKPAPAEVEQPAPVEFSCPQCQATTAYSVADGGLRCAHCGYYEAPKQKVVGKGAEQFEFTVETVVASQRAQGWGEARQVLVCARCQAQTVLPPGSLSHTCPFCGSNQVVQQDAPQDVLRPRFLVPFQIDGPSCERITRDWLGSSWMTPKALRALARVADFSGVYLPYWTFDARTTGDWRGEVGHQHTERYYDSSDRTWKSRTVTVWRWESGRAQVTFDDVLVSGSTRISRVLLAQLGNFDTRQLVPYEPAYLAGLRALAYDVPLEAAWKTARETMREQTWQASRSQASTSQIRNFSMALDFADESWRYVLLPVHVAVYRYAGEAYQVLVNGQTGTIAGQRPADWTRVWLAIAAMLAPGVLLSGLGAVLLLLAAVLPPSLAFGGVLLAVGLVLFLIGAIFAIITFSKAKRMDDV